MHSINADSITLVKKHDDAKLTLIEPSKIVRIIGKERTQGNSTPNLCKRKRLCKEVDDTKLVLDLDGNTIAERAQTQLSNRPIIIIPDEINLTRRALEPMDRFHKLAAAIMLPPMSFVQLQLPKCVSTTSCKGKMQSDNICEYNPFAKSTDIGQSGEPDRFVNKHHDRGKNNKLCKGFSYVLFHPLTAVREVISRSEVL